MKFIFYFKNMRNASKIIFLVKIFILSLAITAAILLARSGVTLAISRSAIKSVAPIRPVAVEPIARKAMAINRNIYPYPYPQPYQYPVIRPSLPVFMAVMRDQLIKLINLDITHRVALPTYNQIFRK